MSTTTWASGAVSRRPGRAVSPSTPAIVRSSSTRSGLQRLGQLERLGAVSRLADDVEATLREQRRERVARDRVVVHDEDPFRHLPSHRQTGACR